MSEVPTLSGLVRAASFLPDDSVQLVFLPEFLCKNQVAGDSSPVIYIPSLEQVVGADDPDRVNCPIRALRTYRTKHRGSDL